jgi:large subunit ribosomal protein L23
MHATQILKKPVITEKSSWEADRHNRYSFEVDRRATKAQIKNAVKQLYGVRVENVRTQVRKGMVYRTRFGMAAEGNWKRAVVEIHPDDRIELF